MRITAHVKLLRQRQSSAVDEARQIVTSTTKERSPRKSTKSCPPPETVPYAVKIIIFQYIGKVITCIYDELIMGDFIW